MHFRTWLENIGEVEDAILGVVGGDFTISDSEKNHLLNRRITDFNNNIMDQLRNLGIIKSIGEQDLQRYSDIIRSIDNGITVKELIDKIVGQRVI